MPVLKYRAFLSYSHRDTAWAKWLHRALEAYHIDKDLIGRETPFGPVPKTLRPIFRDRGAKRFDESRRGFMSALILVVDDEPDVADLFRQQFRKELRAARFAMEFAQSAPEALQRVGAAHDASLILILSDVNMPGMGGLELLPLAREARPGVPVIMITANGDADTRRKAIEAGAAGLLTKPIDFLELRGEIGRRLEAAMGAS